MQRHWLAARIADDCPRCGWHGYFHHYIATIDRDWSAAVCDDCYADLHPAITVTVRYFSACSPIDGEPVAVIRQRTRSDYGSPDRGQMLTWRLNWQHTPMLVNDRRGNCEWEITAISRQQAKQIAARLAAGHWPADAARLALGRLGLPGAIAVDAAHFEDLAGRLYGLVIMLEDRLGGEQAQLFQHFIEVGEYSLAPEEIAGALAGAKIAITDQERGAMLALTARMKMGDLVPHALGFCPQAR